jgi:hypothetical protein
MDTGFLLPIRALERSKLLTVCLLLFGDDPQQVLEAQAGLGPQVQTVFFWLLLCSKVLICLYLIPYFYTV